jgi:hypothetical protein
LQKTILRCHEKTKDEWEKKKQKGGKKMGTNVSSNISRTIVENTTQQTATLFQQFSQTNEGKTDINQAVIVQIDGKLSCANITITNDAKVSMRALNQITAEQNADMQGFVTQVLKSQAETEMAQTNEDLNLLQTNVAAVVNEAITVTRTEQGIACTQAFEQTIVQSSTIDQTISLVVGESGEVFVTGDCNFTQTTSVEYTAQQTVQAAMDVVLAQESVQQAMTEWDTAISQQNKGLSLGAWIGIAIAIAVVIVVIAVLIWAKKKGLLDRKPKTGEAKPAKAPKTPKAKTPKAKK